MTSLHNIIAPESTTRLRNFDQAMILIKYSIAEAVHMSPMASSVIALKGCVLAKTRIVCGGFLLLYGNDVPTLV